jgi:alkanesulfonate monooxygenase SsuD/methylene tetrahydromethanopterin reductase-like flavin-dependent oxidoreductase (luciferase family)
MAKRILEDVLSCTMVGTPATVERDLRALQARTGADEFMVVSAIYDHTARLRSYELTASLQSAPDATTNRT